LVSSSSASWVYDVECLDDIYQTYYQGEIDYDVFSMLVDSYDLGGLKLEDLEAVGAFERTDITSMAKTLPDNKFWFWLLTPQKGKVGFRRYSRDFDKVTGMYFLDLQLQSARLQAETKSSDGEYSWGKRSLFLTSGPLKMTIGNYVVSEGLGLAVGRLDYRPSAGFSNDDGDFMYPVNSYYNGLKLAVKNGNLGERFYYSYKKYGGARKIFAGSGIVFQKNNLTAGISLGLNRFDNIDVVDKRYAIGLNLKIENQLYSLAGEYANVKKSGGLFLRGLRRFNDIVIRTEFWQYGDGFDNYNCSGPSASDYRSFYPGGQGLGFRSAQAGETGLAIDFIKKYLSLGFQIWRQSLKEQANSSFNLRLSGPLPNNLKAMLQTVSVFKDQNGYLWLKTSIMHDEKQLLERAGLKFYFMEKAKIVKVKSYSFIDISYGFKEYLNIFLRHRTYFNGRTRWYFGEELTFASGINISVDVVLYRGKRVNIKVEKLL
jgi:hypothetical protein